MKGADAQRVAFSSSMVFGAPVSRSRGKRWYALRKAGGENGSLDMYQVRRA
jgi:hypothetical protein